MKTNQYLSKLGFIHYRQTNQFGHACISMIVY